MQSTMLRNSILRLPRCGLSLLADSAGKFPVHLAHYITIYIFAASVVRTAAVNKVPNRDDYLWHLLGHLKETPQQRSTNEVGVYMDTSSFCRGRVVLEYHTSYHRKSKPPTYNVRNDLGTRCLLAEAKSWSILYFALYRWPTQFKLSCGGEHKLTFTRMGGLNSHLLLPESGPQQ